MLSAKHHPGSFREIRARAEREGSKIVIEPGTQFGGTKDGRYGFSAFLVPEGKPFDRDLHWVAWFRGLPMSTLQALQTPRAQ